MATRLFMNQERVILGPLTTTFTPPAPCNYAIGLCENCDVAWMGQTCAPETVQDDPNCWPTTTEGAAEASQMLYGWGFYSPGLHCPAGYTSACTAIDGSTAGWDTQFLMEPEETFVGCCPTGFRCDNLNGQTCIMGAKSTTLATVSCESGKSNNFGFTTLPNAEVKVLNLFAPMIQLAWKPTDRTDLPTTTTTTTTPAQSSPTTTTAVSTSTVSATPSASPSSHTTLSTAAIAGIGVGTAVFFFILITSAILIWRRRRNQVLGSPLSEESSTDGTAGTSYPPGYTAATASDPLQPGGGGEGKHYYTGTTTPVVSELQCPPPLFEAPGQGHDRVEMPGQQMVSEMPTERYR